MSSVDKAPAASTAVGFEDVFRETAEDKVDSKAASDALAKDAQRLVLSNLLAGLRPEDQDGSQFFQAPQHEAPEQEAPEHEALQQKAPQREARQQEAPQQEVPQQRQHQPAPPAVLQQAAAGARQPPLAGQPQPQVAGRPASTLAFLASARGGASASSSSSTVYKGANVASTLASIFGDVPVMYTVQFRSLMGGDGGVTEQQLIQRIQQAQDKADGFGKWLSAYLNPWRSTTTAQVVRSALPMLANGPRAQLDPKKLTQELARDLSTALALAAGAIAKDWQRTPLTASQRKRLQQFYDALMEVMPQWPPQAHMSFQDLCQMWLDAMRGEQSEPAEDEEGLRVDEDGRGHGGGQGDEDDANEEHGQGEAGRPEARQEARR